MVFTESKPNKYPSLSNSRKLTACKLKNGSLCVIGGKYDTTADFSSAPGV